MNRINALKVFLALLFTGFPVAALPMAMRQISFESNDFTSRLGTEYNNWSGIRFSHWETGAEAGNTGFAAFKNTYSWARAYKIILKRGDALKQKTIPDFVNSLLQQHYIIDSDNLNNAYSLGMAAKGKVIDAFILENSIIFVLIIVLLLFTLKIIRK